MSDDHEALVKKLFPDENKSNDNFSWTEKYTVSKQEASKYDKPNWLYENLVISGHVIAIPAPANGGKTTIFMFVAGEMAKKGMEVYYVNADIGQSDAGYMIDYANKHKFTLLLPDMKEGLSMDDVVNNLKNMNKQSGDFSGSVFIFDTLKKMTEVIIKNKSKELYKLLRGLSAKGMTIILLSHTNKYKDADGNPIYEGTGDLRTDVDELIYLKPKHHDDGGMTVSTLPDKKRGKFIPITFEIDPDRNVKQSKQFIDVASLQERAARLEKDLPIIEIIIEAINNNKTKQAEIIEYCHERDTPKRRVLSILKEYSSGEEQKWVVITGLEHNASCYKVL